LKYQPKLNDVEKLQVKDVYKQLFTDINNGKYGDGYLPSLKILAAEFDVKEATVRAAVKKLADDQLVVTSHGRRTRVPPGPASSLDEVANEITRVIRDLEALRDRVYRLQLMIDPG
jgi:DNA-binding GntR family transcriptional regulator